MRVDRRSPVSATVFDGLLVVLLTWGVSAAPGPAAPPLEEDDVVEVGRGSYATRPPPGARVPADHRGAPLRPLVTERFRGAIPTSDWASSIVYPFFGDAHSAPLFPHPLTAKAHADGLALGHADRAILVNADYVFPHREDLRIVVDGLRAPDTRLDASFDFAVRASWSDGDRELLATLGHGLPFVYLRVRGGDAIIRCASPPRIWHRSGGVLAFTIGGRHWAVFGPSAAEWTGEREPRSDLAGAGWLSAAILPNDDARTLALFRRHAYAFVTDTRVDWSYDPRTASVVTRFRVETELVEPGEGRVDRALLALYPHQWKRTRTPLGDLSYASPRGTMRLVEDGGFTTEARYHGILPALPLLDETVREELRETLRASAAEAPDPRGRGSYVDGKDLGRLAELVPIADELEDIALRDRLLDRLRAGLELWLRADGGRPLLVHDATWSALIAHPDEFGASKELNDHHFHYGYFLRAAATLARFEPAWTAPDAWGGMVELLIRDVACADRDDPRFPFLRSFDPYAGHSWAAGHGAFGDGNNQESSSESMAFAAALVLWGELTGDHATRDLGVWMWTTEATAIREYWLDVDGDVFPDDYTHGAVGIVFGGKSAHSTWFSAAPEAIHGISVLPLTGGSLYLGLWPEAIERDWEAIVAERGGSPRMWRDVLCGWLALADAERALDELESVPPHRPGPGESRARTLHWIHSLRALGRVDPSVTADTPCYAVFVREGRRTRVVFNAAREARTVRFSDGLELRAPPRRTTTHRDRGTSARR